jgi:hypothetical protein
MLICALPDGAAVTYGFAIGSKYLKMEILSLLQYADRQVGNRNT